MDSPGMKKWKHNEYVGSLKCDRQRLWYLYYVVIKCDINTPPHFISTIIPLCSGIRISFYWPLSFIHESSDFSSWYQGSLKPESITGSVKWTGYHVFPPYKIFMRATAIKLRSKPPLFPNGTSALEVQEGFYIQ